MINRNIYPDHNSDILDLFVGRKFDLDFLNDWGKKGKSPIFIIGDYGVGKTTLANAYAHFSKDFYKKQISFEARQLEAPDALLPLVDKMVGEISNDPILIIIDGLDEIPAFEINAPKLIYSIYHSQKNIRWLITSRAYLASHIFSSNEILSAYNPVFIHLSGFNQREVGELINKRLQWASKSENTVSDFLRKDAGARLHGNPKLINLALELTGDDLHKAILVLKNVIDENFTNIFLTFREGYISALPTSASLLNNGKAFQNA